jgi:hypothetical protein
VLLDKMTNLLPSLIDLTDEPLPGCQQVAQRLLDLNSGF